MDDEHQRHLPLFGSSVGLYLGQPPIAAEGLGVGSVELAALEAEATLRRLHGQLTRFDPNSELSRFNGDPRETVAVSETVLTLVAAAVRAAALTEGLVDATQIAAIERCGYSSSRVGVEPAALVDALAWAPRRRPASANGNPSWQRFEVDRVAMTVRRPTGLGIDSGGIAKGFAADLLANRLGGFSSFAVDCGGDLRIGGAAGLARTVEISHPLRAGESALVFELSQGAIATSGLRTRVWRQGDGYAHHLLDPCSGEPAWTGLIQATALAPTGVEAEARAKAAVLSGPAGAERWLSRFGGAVVADGGEVECFGPITPIADPQFAEAAA